MRVIGGQFRGRRRAGPTGPTVRPTSDRVREAVFDILYSLGGVDGLQVADLFAGTGALGIEALSRGAASVTFVERDPVALGVVRTNLASVGLGDAEKDGDATVVRGDVDAWAATTASRYDLVLCDPPYDFKGHNRIAPHLAQIVTLRGDTARYPVSQRAQPALVLDQPGLARELSLLPDGVSFLGRRDDVAGLLRSSDIVALTSEHEGFPNVVLEAMAARLPVVTTPSGDSGVIVEDGVTGFVVEGDDIAGMARRIVTLSASAELRRTFGEAGRGKVERLYSAHALGGMLLSTYRSIAARLGHTGLAGMLSVNELSQEKALA